MNNKYSVLMAVYHKDKAEWLSFALDSMLNQTISPDEIVLVEDGPLTKELYDVIAEYKKKLVDKLNVVTIETNRGLGHALKVGILECKNEFIARIDADDYACPERSEKQLKLFEEKPELALIGTNVEEFNGTIDNVISHVILPEEDAEIKEFCKSRNPFRHSSIMYRRSKVLEAGNYRDYYRVVQDYDLWNRMIRIGCHCHNIQEPLSYMRIGDDFYARRGGMKYLKSILRFKKEQWKNGDISTIDFIKASIIRTCICLAPNSVRDWFYRKFLRK